MAEHGGRGLVAAAQAALLDDAAFLRGVVTDVLQAILEAEMSAHVGAERYERGDGRSGHRNGHKPRTLHTRVGTLHTRVGTLQLRVPQDREGTFSTEQFARYQRTEQALVVTLRECMCRGSPRAKWRRSPSSCAGRVFPRARFRR